MYKPLPSVPDETPRSKQERPSNTSPPITEVQPPTGNTDIDARVFELVKQWGVDHSPELVAEMIGTILRMARDRLSAADLKLYNRSLKELRYAARMWQPYSDIRKISIFGSARTLPDSPTARTAEAFAKKMCEAGYMIITGGGEGIMGAAQLGATRAHSFGLNIRLPFEQHPNVTIDGDPKLVNFNYFFTRKLNFIKESHALVLFPGGFGTMDEGFEALTLLQTGKANPIPVVMLEEKGGHYWQTWLEFIKKEFLSSGLISHSDFYLFQVTDNVDEAVHTILHFYRNYHSSRYVGQQMVIRLNHALTEKALEEINNQFAFLLRTGTFTQGAAMRQEKNEQAIAHLPRLIFTPLRQDFGELRHLIDVINNAEIVEPSKEEETVLEQIDMTNNPQNPTSPRQELSNASDKLG